MKQASVLDEYACQSAQTIGSIGFTIRISIIQKEGNLLREASASSAPFTATGGSILILPGMNFRQRSGITAVGSRSIRPSRITHPRSAPIISDTATGPGVGGMKL